MTLLPAAADGRVTSGMASATGDGTAAHARTSHFVGFCITTAFRPSYSVNLWL